MELDIRNLFVEILRKWWLIFLTAVLFMIGTIAYTYFYVTPMYTSTTDIYVYNPDRSGTVTTNDLNTSAALVPTYVEILKSNDVIEAVRVHLLEEDGLNYSAAAIRASLSFSLIKDTEIFKLSSTTTDPEHSAKIANAMFEIGRSFLIDITQAGDVKQINKGQVPLSRSSPSFRMNAVLGALVGAVLMLAILVFLMLLDTRIKSVDDLTSSVDLPIMGMIPNYSNGPTTQKGRDLNG